MRRQLDSLLIGDIILIAVRVQNVIDRPSIMQVPTGEIRPGFVVAQDELLILITLLILWATVGRWMYNDARSHESSWAWQWGFGTPLTVLAGLDVMLLVIVIYLLLRGSA